MNDINWRFIVGIIVSMMILTFVFRYFWWLILLLAAFFLFGYLRVSYIVRKTEKDFGTMNPADQAYETPSLKNGDIIDVEFQEHQNGE